MYKEHPLFKPPGRPDATVWRYMDLAKFVSLLDTQRLFFARVDKLGDPFEGSYPKVNVVGRRLLLSAEGEVWRPPASMIESMSRTNAAWPRYHAINCWHLNDHESAAMWKLYLQSSEGIAIRSTFQKLKEALITERDTYIGTVSYIDYDKEAFNEGNSFSAFLHKRKSFEHERELRAIVTEWPTRHDKNEIDFNITTIEAGIPVEVEVATLVDAVYVAPSAPPWFLEVVQALVRRFGYAFEVRQSRLGDTALF